MKYDNPFEREQHDNLLAQVASDLIEDALQFIANDDQVQYTLSPVQYAYEFGTIKLGARRCRGHTPTIKCLADQYDSIIIVPRRQILDLCYPEYKGTGRVFTPTRFKPMARDIEATVCLIDNTSMFTEEGLALVYHTLAHRMTLFVQFQ